jgi:hypothetical protein
VSHVQPGWGFLHRLSEIATYTLCPRVFETYRCKPFGLAEPKRWIRREKGCDVSVVVVGSTRSTAYGRAIMTRIAPYVIAALALGLSACTNPYDPVQRGLGGGILGAASGAAIGAAAGGGPGAALGAAIGGATGIVGGVASTPPPPPGTYYGYPAYGPPAYEYSRLWKFRLPAAGLWISGLRTAPLQIPRLLGIPRLLRFSGLWIPRLLGTARLPRLSGLWIPEPPALFSLLRFTLWISRGWLSRRSPFRGLVAWSRVRYRAC